LTDGVRVWDGIANDVRNIPLGRITATVAKKAFPKGRIMLVEEQRAIEQMEKKELKKKIKLTIKMLEEARRQLHMKAGTILDKPTLKIIDMGLDIAKRNL
jgi:hypothetical protein